METLESWHPVTRESAIGIDTDNLVLYRAHAFTID
jgi:hypothetical protein